MKNRGFCAMVFLAATFAIGQDTPAQPNLSDRVGRLEVLADLWGKLWLFHSSIVTTDVDWNRTLIDVIPKVEEARDVDALIAVLNENLFPSLNDPALVAYRSSSIQPAEARPLSARRLSENVGYIDATDPLQHSQRDYAQRFQQMVADLDGVKAIVVDLRCQYGTEGSLYSLLNTSWLGAFTGEPLAVGHYVYREYNGWNPDNRVTFPYHQEWGVSSWSDRGFGGKPLLPLAEAAATKTPVLILVNNATYRVFAPELDALQTAGRASVAWEKSGPFFAEGLVGPAVMDYGDFQVSFQAGTLLSRSGGRGLLPDFVSGGPISDQTVLELATQVPIESHPQRPSFRFEMRFPRPEQPSDRELSREERLLGLFKIWIVTKYFDPHLELASIDWDTALLEWIPRVEAATTSKEYFRDTLPRLVARLNDSHAYIGSSFGGVNGPDPWATPVLIWPVEDKFVVADVEKWDDAVDIAPGDEIVVLDGKPVSEVKQHYHDVTSNSSYQSEQRLWRSSLEGPEGVPVELTLSRNGRTWTVSVPRDRPWNRRILPSYKQVKSRLLPGGIGYVSVSAIKDRAELDELFALLRSNKGLILDIREPNWIGGSPGSWFFEQLVAKPIPSGTSEIPLVSTYDESGSQGFRFFRRPSRMRPPTGADPYTNPVVVLVGSWVQSAWEGVTKTLQQIDHVTLVGAITPGANGNITQVPLPGGGTFTFTGMRVLHPDGSRFQNIGIIPDVEVYPTVEGIRTGRDEVLEKGIEVLRQLIADAE